MSWSLNNSNCTEASGNDLVAEVSETFDAILNKSSCQRTSSSAATSPRLQRTSDSMVFDDSSPDGQPDLHTFVPVSKSISNLQLCSDECIDSHSANCPHQQRMEAGEIIVDPLENDSSFSPDRVSDSNRYARSGRAEPGITSPKCIAQSSPLVGHGEWRQQHSSASFDVSESADDMLSEMNSSRQISETACRLYDAMYSMSPATRKRRSLRYHSVHSESEASTDFLSTPDGRSDSDLRNLLDVKSSSSQQQDFTADFSRSCCQDRLTTSDDIVQSKRFPASSDDSSKQLTPVRQRDQLASAGHTSPLSERNCSKEMAGRDYQQSVCVSSGTRDPDFKENILSSETLWGSKVSEDTTSKSGRIALDDSMNDDCINEAGVIGDASAVPDGSVACGASAQVSKSKNLTPKSPGRRVRIESSNCNATEDDVVRSEGTTADGGLSRKRSIKEIKSQLENRLRPDGVGRDDDKKIDGDSVLLASSVAERRKRFQSSSGDTSNIPLRPNPERCRTPKSMVESELLSADLSSLSSASTPESPNARVSPGPRNKGRYMTRSSAFSGPIAEMSNIILGDASQGAPVQKDFRDYGRLTDRRKVFEAADGGPVV